MMEGMRINQKPKTPAVETNMKPIETPEVKNTENNFEITKRFAEAERFAEEKTERAILRAMELLESNSKKIGIGKNAEVFSLENEPAFQEICIKKMNKFPQVKINTIETEVEFQDTVSALGIRTPRSIMMLRNKNTREEYIVMEKINGHSIGDLLDERSNSLISDSYNHDEFFNELKMMVEKMHDHKIYHRDLHSGNVMVDEKGRPVIIDFGAADYGYGQEEDIYRGDGLVLTDSKRGIYQRSSSMLYNDDQMVKSLEIKMRKYK